MFSKRRAGTLGLVLAMLGALSLAATTADARVGGGSSFGSRGSRTISSPPATNTAPRAAPIEKSITQPGKVPVAASSTAGSRTWFGGWRGILLGGLFAGIFASVFGFGALASVLGFLLQAALFVGAVWLVMNWFRSRQLQPATASASAARSRAASDVNYQSGLGAGGSSSVEISKADYDAFERLLGEIQLAYGKRDERVLRELVTPEMLSYFLQDLEADRRRGLRNEVASPKLLQGDLAEAWREGTAEYATVAMRFSLLDAKVDVTGRVVEGSRTVPQEVTEIWTFSRPTGGRPDQWELSAIQQEGERLSLAS
jgi:predicted lipid-binding transport protein (Tim44 family)